MTNIIHGIDYLIDFYHILEVKRDADFTEIKKEYRKKARQNHPDVVARAAPEIQKEAERMTKILRQGYEILKDKEKRAAYDHSLENFEPHLISKNGNPIIDPLRRRLDVDHLIGGEKLKAREQMIGMASMMSGHNEETLKIIAQQYNLTDDPSPELKKAYKDLLEKKITYLAALEDTYWHDAGLANPGDPSVIFYADEHLGKRKEQIEGVESEIADKVQERVLALGSGLAPKMLTAGGETVEAKDVKDDSTALMQRLTELATDSFKKHIPELEEIAEERSKVIGELVKLTEWEYFPPEQEQTDKVMIVIENKGKILGNFGYEFDGENLKLNSELSKVTIDKDISLEDLKASKERIEKLTDKGANFIILSINPEIDNMLQMGYVVRQHFGFAEEDE